MRQDDRSAERNSISQMWRKGLAGGLAGCTARTVVAPLERVKILFQTAHPGFVHHTTSRLAVLDALRTIQTSCGTQALFQGHSLTLLRTFPDAAINFLAYEQLRSALITAPDEDTPSRLFISGSLAGAISMSCTYPLELIRVNLAFQSRPTSLVVIWNHIYRDGGLRTSAVANFYRGYTPTLLATLPYAGMSFFAHDLIGDWFRSPFLASYTSLLPAEHMPSRLTKRIQLTAPAELLSGALAGMVAQTVSYPLEVIRRRMQVSGMNGGHISQAGIADTARTILVERGIRGFYVGLTIGYIKVVPMVATSFFVYDRLKWYLGVY
ncbi:mitochondrial carrier [Aspergillus steynii IBT 23096]|uniref:Mitochondrial thiamine pyrophosphate carrier 1 n=1 Tax=Aspergillus steynii IBT 23096 TaxID=1392250 RepID=A0A2I2G1D7_9EURO|nr:mitochondrial carrier [Aspergillus steynii IBT 23096]PLB46688.1 mitochondrial carrier [Aspergillus steynii IBT 23096]